MTLFEEHIYEDDTQNSNHFEVKSNFIGYAVKSSSYTPRIEIDCLSCQNNEILVRFLKFDIIFNLSKCLDKFQDYSRYAHRFSIDFIRWVL